MSTLLQYTIYGYDGCDQYTPVLRFNGQRKESATGHYLLGNGYRAFNPVLMRFHSPDSLSPMGGGGINCYAYCGGDPVNYIDPEGRTRFSKIAETPRLQTVWEDPAMLRPQKTKKLPSTRQHAGLAGHVVSEKVVGTLNKLGRSNGDQIQTIMNSRHWSVDRKLLVEGAVLKLSSNFGENLKRSAGYTVSAAATPISSNRELMDALAVVVPLNEKMQAAGSTNTLVNDIVASWLHGTQRLVLKVRNTVKAG